MGAGAISSPQVVSRPSRRIECSMLQYKPALPPTVAFKLDTVYSDSPSSLYSFCMYSMPGFFHLQSGLSISSAFQSSCPRTIVFKLDTVLPDSPSSLYSFCKNGVLGFLPPAAGLSISSALVYLWPKPGLQAEKGRAPDCLQAGYSITRQSTIDISFLYLWCVRFFPPAVRV